MPSLNTLVIALLGRIYAINIQCDNVNLCSVYKIMLSISLTTISTEKSHGSSGTELGLEGNNEFWRERDMLNVIRSFYTREEVVLGNSKTWVNEWILTLESLLKQQEFKIFKIGGREL